MSHVVPPKRNGNRKKTEILPRHFQLSPDAGLPNEDPTVLEAFFSHYFYQAIIMDGGLYMYQNDFMCVPSIWIISCVRVTMSFQRFSKVNHEKYDAGNITVRMLIIQSGSFEVASTFKTGADW